MVAFGFQVSFMALSIELGNNPWTLAIDGGSFMGAFYAVIGLWGTTMDTLRATHFGTFLISVYAVVAQVILVNLLIAMMGDTFSTVKANSDVEWKYCRLLFTIDQSLRSFQPPPFNLLILPFHYFVRLCRSEDTAKSDSATSSEDSKFQIGDPMIEYALEDIINGDKEEGLQRQIKKIGSSTKNLTNTVNELKDSIGFLEQKFAGIESGERSSVAVLVVLKIAENEKEYAVLTVDLRTSAEIPTGRIEDDRFVGISAYLLKERLKLDIEAANLMDLTQSSSVKGGISRTPLYVYRKIVSGVELERLKNQATVSEEGKKVSLKIVPLEEMWLETTDFKALSALLLYKNLQTNSKLVDL